MHVKREPATPIPVGALLTISTGEYSDYYIHGVFRAKTEIDADTLITAWLEKHPEQNEDYKFDERGFIASISNMLEPVDCWEFHVGDYGEPNEYYTEKMES